MSPVPWRQLVLSRLLGPRLPAVPLRPSEAFPIMDAFEHAPVAMAVLEPGGLLLRANPALCRLLDMRLQDLVGATLFDRTHPDDLDLALTVCRDISDGRVDLTTMQCRLLRPDGEVRTAVVTASLVRRPQGTPAHLVLHVQDVTDLRALERELRHQTLHDELTGLPNRTLFIDRLEQTIAACGRQASTFALLFLDVDRFKQVNDVYGHGTGDAVLVELAARLRDAIRPADTAARFSGDEFLVLCPDVDAGQADEVRRRLLDRLCLAVTTSHGTVAVSVSAGVALGDASSRPVDVLREADQRMYQNKHTPEA